MQRFFSQIVWTRVKSLEINVNERNKGCEYWNIQSLEFGNIKFQLKIVFCGCYPIIYPPTQGVGNEKKGVGNELTPRSECPEQKHFLSSKIWFEGVGFEILVVGFEKN